MQILAVVIRSSSSGRARCGGSAPITQWTRTSPSPSPSSSRWASLPVPHRGGGFSCWRKNTGLDLFLGVGFSIPRVLLVVLTLTSGVALLMWMGELTTQRGIGNGMSLLIFASVVSSLPANFWQVKLESGLIAMFGVLLMFTAIMVAIVFIEQGQRRIPVQFAKRVVDVSKAARAIHPAK